MAKKGTETKPSEARAQPNQRLPTGHFDNEGRSMGKMDGDGRKVHDAYQGPRPSGGESK